MSVPGKEADEGDTGVACVSQPALTITTAKAISSARMGRGIARPGPQGNVALTPSCLPATICSVFERAADRLPPGALLHRYRIERLIGQGGIASVFLAHDLTLHRDVAIKVIDAPDDTNAHEHLLHEARNAAALNHPCICTVHEVGETDGLPFIAMEFVEGRSLRELLKEHQFSLDEALQYGIQAADALGYAHSRGVLHRDFKAENLMCTAAGRLKIVDFGLGRRTDAVMSAATTMESLIPPGAIAGTPYTMAPEQVRGEPADRPTDVWALGVLLYEMAAGRRPFEADTRADLFSAILRDPPAALPAAVPPPLATVITRCLQKQPNDRYPDAGGVHAALKAAQSVLSAPGPATARTPTRLTAPLAALLAIVVGASLVWQFRATLWTPLSRSSTDANSRAVVGQAPRRSIGLLGFNNLAQRAELAYISTALDQGLGSDLALGNELRIVSGEEIARMKQDLRLRTGEPLAQDTLREVKATLDIDVIVTGSYTAVGSPGDSQVRVDIRVQDTQTGQLLGALSSSGTESGLLAIIADSGIGVRRTLGISDGLGQRRETGALPASVGARRLYAEGLDALRQWDTSRARELFERSIAQEPDFALAHVGLATTWSILGYDSQAAKEAAAATSLAKTLRPEEQQWIEGLYREYMREWTGAIASYSALVKTYPDQPDYALKLVDAQISAGLGKDALKTLDDLVRAVPQTRTDPRVSLAEASVAEALGDTARQESAARRSITAAEAIGARVLIARASIALARALQLKGDVRAAIDTNETARGLFQDAGDRRGVARALIQLGAIARERGNPQNAERTLQTAVDISRDIGNKRQMSQALNELANVYFDLRRFDAAASIYQEAVAVSQELGDEAAEARALGNLASAFYEQGNVTQSQRLDQQALSIKRRLGDERSIAFSLLNMAETAGDLGDLDGAQKMYQEGRTIFERLNAPAQLSVAFNGLSMVALRRDQLPLARQMAERAVQVCRDAADAARLLTAQTTLLNVLIESADLTAASTMLMDLDSRVSQASAEQRARLALARARLSAARGDVIRAPATSAALPNRNSESYSAATTVMLELQDARTLAAAGNRSSAAEKVRNVATRMRSRNLVAFELEAELVLAEIRASDPRSLSSLIDRSRRAQFALVARKAESLRRQ